MHERKKGSDRVGGEKELGPETLTGTARCRAEDIRACWSPEIHSQVKGGEGWEIKPPGHLTRPTDGRKS